MQRQPTPDIMGDVLVAKSGPELIPLDRIRVDGGTQMRAALNDDTVREYADAFMTHHAWGDFPAVILYYDGTDYWVADGFHRIEAYRRAVGGDPNTTPVHADVRAGNRRDAILYAAGANASHGLRRTQADKRRSVETLLRDDEWRKWSDREIARICHVSADLVGDVRKTIAPPVTVDSDSETVRTYTNRHGGTSTMRVDNIGSNQPQYAQVWELERHVAEFARNLGWQALDLRSAARNQHANGNYRLLKETITVEYRRADLVQALHNVANQMEAKQAAAVPAGRSLMEVMKTDAELAAEAEAADIAEREAAADEATRQATAASTYGAGIVVPELAAEWKQLQSQWELDPTGQTAPRKVVRDDLAVANHLRNWLSRRHQDFPSEYAEYSIRQMLGYWMEGKWPAVLEEFTATLPEGWTQDALDDAIREVHAEYAPDSHPVEIDPWAAALATSGSRQHRAELLAEALQPWILAYQDEYGRTWRDLARGGNPSHTNSTFWRHITAEAKRRSITAFQDDLWKFAIKQAFSWLEANEPSAAADVTPVTLAVDADKLLVDWTDDDWETHALRSQAEAPAAEPQRRVDEDAILTPVSLRPDYDSDEWYTPAEYIEAARTVMGSIDLDPASCELAQTVVQADVYLTKIENGLGLIWIRETVWLNPPYGQAEPWVAKLLAEFDGGAFVQQAVVLLNNMTETAYFQALLTRFPVCFPNRRIPFWRHDQQGLTGRQGQAIFYLGPNVERFVEVFGAFGPVLRRV